MDKGYQGAVSIKESEGLYLGSLNVANPQINRLSSTAVGPTNSTIIVPLR